MSKFYLGEIVKFNTEAVQYVKNKDQNKGFLLVTSRAGDIYIPIDTVYKALEDTWRFEDTMRNLKDEKV